MNGDRDGVMGPLNWSVLRVYKKKIPLLTVSLFKVCNRVVMYWSWSHRDAVALVEVEEELSLGFKSNFHVRGSPREKGLME